VCISRVGGDLRTNGNEVEETIKGDVFGTERLNNMRNTSIRMTTVQTKNDTR